MIRIILFFLAFTVGMSSMAQKPQRIGYIDMEYILENVPEYIEAQSRLKAKVQTWEQKLTALKREIEVMKTDLSNEKPLLTAELISEREEDIQIKELDLKNLQASYFGPTGDLYLLRKQLVKPVQDQVYNAVQNIAVSKKYDLILDKSSDLIMLYSNKRFDVSELVLNSIVRGRKKAQLEAKKNQIQEKKETGETVVDERAQKRIELQNRIKAQNEAKAKKREELKKAAAENRRKRLEEIENRKKKLIASRNKQPTDSISSKTTDSIPAATIEVSKDSIAKAKRAALLDRLKKQQEAKAKKKEALRKAAEDKRKKRLEEIEKRKKQKEEQKKKNN